MIFATIGRSWQYAKTAYGMLWDHKHLLVFPMLSAVALLLVSASYLLPLWGTGTLESWQQQVGDEEQSLSWMAYLLTFLFYFTNYFVIIFFNCGLVACVMQVMRGERPTIGAGLRMAAARAPQIIAWAFISAVVGLLLRAVENAHEKAGAIISAVLGMAWTALTYFVVPVIVVDGVGPVEAFKRSAKTLKSTWGEALVGNFSLGFLGFLIALPVLLVCGLLIYGAVGSGSMVLLVLAIALTVVLVGIIAAASAAADMIFKGLLFSYATGRTLPENVDAAMLNDAFRQRN